MAPTDNETWVIETGAVVIQKMADHGDKSLSRWELMVYLLWIADYGMRNAGDLRVTHEMYPGLLKQARQVSKELALPLTRRLFAKTESNFEKAYLDCFEEVCDEIRLAKPE